MWTRRLIALAAFVTTGLMMMGSAHALPYDPQGLAGAGVVRAASGSGVVAVAIEALNGTGVRSMQVCSGESACAAGAAWHVQKVACSTVRVDTTNGRMTWFGGAAVRVNGRDRWLAVRIVDGGATGSDSLGLAWTSLPGHDALCGAGRVAVSRLLSGAFQQIG